MRSEDFLVPVDLKLLSEGLCSMECYQLSVLLEATADNLRLVASLKTIMVDEYRNASIKQKIYHDHDTRSSQRTSCVKCRS